MCTVSIPSMGHWLPCGKIKACISFQSKGKIWNVVASLREVKVVDTSQFLQKLQENQTSQPPSFSPAMFHHQISLCRDCLTRCSVPPRARESSRPTSPARIWGDAKDVCLTMSRAHWPKAQAFEPNSSFIKRDTRWRHEQAVLN